eukprot:4105257-Amphidinium_carterae.1
MRSTLLPRHEVHDEYTRVNVSVGFLLGALVTVGCKTTVAAWGLASAQSLEAAAGTRHSHRMKRRRPPQQPSGWILAPQLRVPWSATKPY